MKKNVILSLIPACLLLASCSAPQEKTYENELGNIIETTDAEDKEFLDAEIKYSDVSPISSIPSVGIQSVPKGEDKVNFRFIAAVQLTDKNDDGIVDDEDFAVGDVIWERKAYKFNDVKFKDPREINATKVYKRVSAANKVFDIEEFNQEHGTSYTHFVTYVIRGVDTNFGGGNGVLMANARLKDHLKSNTLVTSINENTQFSFSSKAPEYCLVKKHADGLCETYGMAPSYVTNGPMCYEISLDDPNDSIIFLEQSSESFIYSSDYENSDVELERVNDSYLLKPKDFVAGDYIFSYNGLIVNLQSATEYTAELVVDDQNNSTWNSLKGYINKDQTPRLLARVVYNVGDAQCAFYYEFDATANLYDYTSKFLVPSGVDFKVCFAVYDGSVVSYQTTEVDVTQPTGNTTLTCTLGTEDSVTWTQA